MSRLFHRSSDGRRWSGAWLRQAKPLLVGGLAQALGAWLRQAKPLLVGGLAQALGAWLRQAKPLPVGGLAQALGAWLRQAKPLLVGGLAQALGRYAALALLAVAVPAAAQEGPRFHTRSIVACDPVEDACGISVVSFPTGVPAIVPVGEPGVMVANQSFPSFATAREVIAQIQMGDDAPTALADALALDPDFELRQLGVAALFPANPSGVTVANFTGAENIPETCEVLGDTYAVQANLQTSSAVCQAMADAFAATQGSLAPRLLAALLAGGAVGTDARGEFSASVKVFSASWALADITPLSADGNVNRSARWEEDLSFEVSSFLAFLTPADERNRVELDRFLAKDILKVLRDLGFYQGPASGQWSDEAETGLLDFGAFNVAFPSGTVVVDGIRFIDGPLSFYVLEGMRRGVLTPAP